GSPVVCTACRPAGPACRAVAGVVLSGDEKNRESAWMPGNPTPPTGAAAGEVPSPCDCRRLGVRERSVRKSAAPAAAAEAKGVEALAAAVGLNVKLKAVDEMPLAIA